MDAALAAFEPDPDEGRFEYRVWGDLDDVRRDLERLGDHAGDTTVHDRYLLSGTTDVSAKLRDGALETKHLVEVCDGFQRWRPAWRAEAPFGPPAAGRLLHELGAPVQPFPDGCLDETALATAFAERDDLTAVVVDKFRHRFRLAGVRAEATFVSTSVRELGPWTVAVESRDLARLRAVTAELGIDRRPNVAVNVALQTAGAGP